MFCFFLNELIYISLPKRIEFLLSIIMKKTKTYKYMYLLTYFIFQFDESKREREKRELSIFE